MDYMLQYYKLIRKAIDRGWSKKTAIVYVEKHHIVPKRLGGSNELDNLACLTAREHFVAHKLLFKAMPGNFSIANAYHSFCMTPPNSSRKLMFTSHDFKSLREAAINKSKGDNNPMRRPEVAAKFKGDLNPMRRPEVAAKFKGDLNPMKRPEVLAKISGSNSYLYKGAIIAESLDGSVVIELEDLKEAKEYGFNPSNVSQVIKGNRKHNKGFTFTRIME